MANTRTKDTRQRVVRAADRLVHLQGFKHTTLADVASASGVALGNIHYYFRTKESLGEALIEQRAAGYRTLRDRWNELPTARERLLAFIQMTIDNRELLARSGCPIGSLCQELHKEGGGLAERATEMFADFLEWLETQFREMGHGEAASTHALHLMSALEGATLLTNSFRSTSYLEQESNVLKAWLHSL